MPKKFPVNQKAAEGRQRKADAEERKRQVLREQQEAAEAREWEVGAKKVSAKKAQEELARQEKLAKKQERKELEAKESAEISSGKLRANNNRGDADERLSTTSTMSSTGALIKDFSSFSIDDALAAMNQNESASQDGDGTEIDRHPEKRAKAAYANFERREMARLKEDNPTLRHSQLKTRLYKLWQKSPDNPMNQQQIPFNYKDEGRE